MTSCVVVHGSCAAVIGAASPEIILVLWENPTRDRKAFSLTVIYESWMHIAVDFAY